MKDPGKIPEKVKAKLKKTGLWDIDPINLFRISWKNEPKNEGGLYRELPNYIEIPSEISGVKARIFAMAGKFFPIGAHKVGASFGCLVPRLVTGQFDPKFHEAVWPSTGNYCRGGAYNSALLGCKSIAILPENMSKERFEWLSKVAGEVIATPGCESNVKEIYDKTWELRRTRDNVVIFNQFGELGNHLWHYEVTGNAMNDVVKAEAGEKGRLA
jgi:cysteine synthase